MTRIFLAITFCLTLLSCQYFGSHEIDSSSKTLFRRVLNSGIDFRNPLNPTIELSAFNYQYYQNGGGVAVADFDQDGLTDIFFTANLASDKLYRNKGDWKFEDVTELAGVDGYGHGVVNSWSTGVTITDVNDDGYPDIYICKSGFFRRGIATQNVLYVNNHDLTFTEASEKYGLNDPGYSTQAVFFDYDKDMDLDAYVLNHSVFHGNAGRAYVINQDPSQARPHSGSLYRNDNGYFVDVTIPSGLCDFSYGLGVTAGDLNDDGWTDLYVANDFSRPDRLYVNQGDGTFRDRLKEGTGHISYFSMGCDVADINNDGLLDISVVDMAPATNFRSKTLMPSMSIEDFRTFTKRFEYIPQYMFNTLQINHGDGRFSDIAKLLEVHKTDWSWATLLADFDNDGWKDMFVSNGYKYNKIENDFAREVDELFNQYGANVPAHVKAEWIHKPPSYKLANYFFKNIEGKKFKKQSKEWGILHETFSNGAAYADLDNDGDLDLVVNNLDDPADIYENTSKSNYLQIDLQSDGMDRLAVSLNASIDIYFNNGMQRQESTLTRGFQSSCDAIIHFGLGKVEKVDSLIITWSDGKRQQLLDISSNQKLEVDKLDAFPFSPQKLVEAEPLFSKSSIEGIDFKHQENEYDDFEKELLLPHRNSMHGPFISKGDVNLDGLEDFFVGGAAGQAGVLYIQKTNNEFVRSQSQPWSQDKQCEDMKSLFFDVENDGDLDLYVVSGGNEYEGGNIHYQDRLYLNNGNSNFSKSAFLPEIRSSGSVVVAFDYNQDQLPDLFVGGRMEPQRYPYASSSYLLKNTGNGFEDVSSSDGQVIRDIGIVTDAISSDLNNDGLVDLIVVGEWTPVRILENTGSFLRDVTPQNLTEEKGWWYSVQAGDFDNDGDIDLVAGNLGLNYKYKASKEEPFQVYGNDFDRSGSLDIVLGYFNEGTAYPVRGRECSSQQMPFLQEKFPTYSNFAVSSIHDIYGDALEESLELTATNFGSSFLINTGNWNFDIRDLPTEAQFSCVNSIIVEDFNSDQNLDLLLAGNMFESEVETPRNDAGTGLLLLGDGNGFFDVVTPKSSGFYENGDVKDLESLQVGGEMFTLATNNNDSVTVHQINRIQQYKQ